MSGKIDESIELSKKLLASKDYSWMLYFGTSVDSAVYNNLARVNAGGNDCYNGWHLQAAGPQVYAAATKGCFIASFLPLTSRPARNLSHPLSETLSPNRDTNLLNSKLPCSEKEN